MLTHFEELTSQVQKFKYRGFTHFILYMILMWLYKYYMYIFIWWKELPYFRLDPRLDRVFFPDIERLLWVKWDFECRKYKREIPPITVSLKYKKLKNTDDHNWDNQKSVSFEQSNQEFWRRHTTEGDSQ